MAQIVAQKACFCQKRIFWSGASRFKLSVMAGTRGACTNDPQGDQP
jgi:hypothetical protein